MSIMGQKIFGPHLMGDSDIVIGRVLGIHVKGEYINDEVVSTHPPLRCHEINWL